MSIQFIDLKAQQQHIQAKIQSAINQVLSHGIFIMGPEVKELEEQLASYAGVKHAVTCSSGTDALLMALMSRGIGRGDAVFTTPFTFIATAEVITLLGATPVFVDIDPRTFNINPIKLDKSINKVIKEGKLSPKAIIPVDIYGLPADYDEIMAIANEHNLFVLEDGAQSFGAEYKGRKACSLAHAAATSFFPAKPLGCYGDGGAVLTDDDELAATVASIRLHGKGGHKYDNIRTGLNARLDTLQAAILLQKLAVFPEEFEYRQSVALQYSEGLQGKVEVPFIPDDYISAWAQYSVLAKSETERTVLQATLKEAGVPTAVYYPKPLHLQTAFAYLGYKTGGMPIAEGVSKRIFSLPMHPYLKEEEIEKIVAAIG